MQCGERASERFNLRFIEPVELSPEEVAGAKRPVEAHLAPAKRRKNFAEVELGLTEIQACAEARRCLRCDLDTKDAQNELALRKKS